LTTILLTCGETSGEQHAARLVGEIKRLDPSCAVRALGGDVLERAGADVVFPLESYAVMGFAEVLSRLPRFHRLERSLRALLAGGGIDLFLPVDYPGLNLRLARYARRLGVPVLYFISPQIWAWGAWRLKRMRESIDLMAAILPFEVDLYRRAGIPVVFAGHPMLDEIAAPPGPKDAPVGDAPFTVLLLPGSRRQVFEKLFGVFMDAAALLRRRFPSVSFAVALAPLVSDAAARVPEEMRAFVRTTRSGAAELTGAALALSASGTATLQCALSGTPTVVAYRMSPLTYAIGRSLVRIPWIAMPNVLAGRPLVPELIQGAATAERLAAEAAAILRDGDRYRRISADLLSLRGALDVPGGIGGVARAALAMAAGERGEEIARGFGGGGGASR
jgi:lipid-A-disaccharide synthase